MIQKYMPKQVGVGRAAHECTTNAMTLILWYHELKILLCSLENVNRDLAVITVSRNLKVGNGYCPCALNDSYKLKLFTVYRYMTEI